MTSLHALPNEMPRIIACIEDQPARDGFALEPIAAFCFHIAENVIRVRATVRSDSRDQHSNHGSQHFGRADVGHEITSLPAPGFVGRAALTDMRGPSINPHSAQPAKIARCGSQATLEATAPTSKDSHIGGGLWREFHPSSWEKNPRIKRQEAG